MSVQPARPHDNHLLEISADSRSLATTLFGIVKMKQIIFTERFEITVRFRNVRNIRFTGGGFSISIVWPNGTVVSFGGVIPPLDPDEPYAHTTYVTNAISEGFALCFARVTPYDAHKADLINENGDPRGEKTAFHSILARDWGTIYTRWALWTAVVGFLLLVLDRMISLAMLILDP